MLALVTEALVGSEVTLRPLSLDDVAALTAAAAESREHFGLSFVPDGPNEMRRYVERFLRQHEQGSRVPFVTTWRGRVVGATSFIEPRMWEWPRAPALQRTDRPDVVEIGSTWLAESARRTRCNTEAKLLMLTYAFEGWEVHSVSFKTDERNARSRRAIERLGARFEGIRRADMPGADGTVRSSAYYSIVAAEWPVAKRRLQQRLAGPEPRDTGLITRSFEPADRSALEALWGRVFPDDPPGNAPSLMIANKLKVQPELLLVGVSDGMLVGAVMAGFDGVRGWIYHLAVAPEHRRRGIATKLVRAAESGLRRLGCPKVNIQVRVSNAEVVAFYRSLGFAIEERLSLGRRLDGAG